MVLLKTSLNPWHERIQNKIGEFKIKLNDINVLNIVFKKY